MFPFGSQYLRGLTPRMEDWDADLAAMRQAGFNTIRAWLVWGVLEPRPGEIDFGYLQRFLDLAHRHELRAILLFHLHGAPEWLCRTHAQHWYVDARGQAFEPSQRSNTPSGGWPGLCPDHAEVQQLEANFIAAVVARFGEHPAAAFWEPVNEPHMWVDLAQSPPGPFCWCPASRAAFVEWLRGRYGELGRLEQAWGRRFGSWQDVRPPTWRFGFADWMDWRTFTADNVARHVDRRAEVIRRHTRRPVIAHAWGGGCVTCGQLGAMAFDDWKNARGMDMWGYSAFPLRPEHVVGVGLGTDATRGAAGGKEFWQSELGSGDYGCGLDRGGRMRPDVQAMFCWESIRHGAKGLLFWQYRKEAHGSEMGAYGLTDYAGGPTSVLRAVVQVGRALNRHAELFRSAQPPAAPVAIVFSFRTWMADWAQHRDNRLSVDCLGGYYRLFWDTNIPVDILHEEMLSLEQLRRYRLVVLPMPAALATPARPVLKEFILGGGNVLSDPYLCGFNPDGSLAREVPGDGMAELFGCREIDILEGKGRRIALDFAGRRLVIARSHLQELLEPLEGAAVLATYEDGTAAIVARAHGAGRAILSGLNLGLPAATGHVLADDADAADKMSPAEAVSQIVLSLAAEAGVQAPLTAPANVRASVLSAPDAGVTGQCRRVLIAINIADAPQSGLVRLDAPQSVLVRPDAPQSGAVRLGGPPPAAATDLLTDQPLPVGPNGIELSWAPYESRVILLQP